MQRLLQGRKALSRALFESCVTETVREAICRLVEEEVEDLCGPR
jgi:hypothetical protein